MELAIRSKIIKSGQDKLRILQDTLVEFWNIEIQGRTLVCTADGAAYSDLYPANDRVELGITYNRSGTWTYRGTVYNMPINMSVEPEAFLRLLVNMYTAHAQPRISFFQWADKYYERYGNDYSHMLYQLGIQLVGTGTMLLDLGGSIYARWDSMISPFKVWYSLEPMSEIGVINNLRFGMYEQPATHVFNVNNGGYKLCLTNVNEVFGLLKSIVDKCLSALAINKSVGFNAQEQKV